MTLARTILTVEYLGVLAAFAYGPWWSAPLLAVFVYAWPHAWLEVQRACRSRHCRRCPAHRRGAAWEQARSNARWN